MRDKKRRKISILGVAYNIYFDCDAEELPEDADGCMDCSTKTIKVLKHEVNRNSLQNMEAYEKKILRHEIIHAFMYESGLWNCSGTSDAWGQDETITDWLAIQMPKIFEVFKECDCL